MPHVVIEGPITAERVHHDLEPFEERHGKALLKLRESFLAKSGRIALLEAIVVEGTVRRFLIQVDEREQSVTVRLFPLTDPEKTDGVKLLLARVALRVKALDARLRFGPTNLKPYLVETTAPADGEVGAGAPPGSGGGSGPGSTS